MAVHIIFRSGGLIISMLLGWLVAGKRYTITQICSVNLVTLGVVLTTLSASPSSHSYSKSPELGSDTLTYITGIAILTLALVFSGFLGLVQDWTYSKYGRPAPPSSSPSANGHSTTEKSNDKGPPAWQESMFYLHFLALPMFISLRSSLSSQIAQINSGSHTALSLPLPLALSKFEPNLSIPTAYIPLTLNTLTQLVCVAGVHRLTTRVSALTVTLVLVVRKAVSLVLSVVGIGLVQRNRGRAQGDVDMVMMWAGAAMVLVGTIFYSGASRAN
ncbi:hypothetical protein H0H92_011691 [Tricholoma furcatifolium]|nr:hypothetical protein H0H92_011691 [Tricholoma furcatifolium]